MDPKIQEIDDMIKKYIYESPDGGDTVYQREFGKPNSERELVKLAKEYKEIKSWQNDDISVDELIDDDMDELLELPEMQQQFSFSTSAGTPITTVDIANAGHIFSETTMEPSVEDRLDAIEKRLSILKPDPDKQEKYKVLQSLYEQYKAAEALLDAPGPEDKNE